jgi:hypothetical protein
MDHHRLLLLGLGFEKTRGGLEQLKNFRVLDSIKNPEAILPALQDSRLLQNRQVLGDIGLLLVDGREDLTNAPLASFQKIQNLKAGGLPQGFEDQGLIFQDLF